MNFKFVTGSKFKNKNGKENRVIKHLTRHTSDAYETNRVQRFPSLTLFMSEKKAKYTEMYREGVEKVSS